MLTFAVAWGIFWLLVWAAAWGFGVLARSDGCMFAGVVGTVISVFYLVAIGLANLLT